MAGIRLRCEHRDLSGAVRTLFIYDRDLVSSQNNIVLCTSDFYLLKHEGDANDPFKRIIPCNCQFTIFLKHPNYELEEQNEVNSFFNDLITSHEGRFYVRCQYGETLGEIEQEFLGKILPDIGELTLDQWETVQLTAIDGISGLKDVEYRPTNYTDLTPTSSIETRKFKDHFIDILRRNDVVDFFQTNGNFFGTSFITTSAFWTESKSISGDIFNQVRIRNVYFEKVGKTYRKYQSCYEVLEDLLTGFVARCICASGKYHIEQLPYQDNLTLTRYGYKYNYDPMAGFTYGNKQTLNYTTNNNIRALTWPSKRWLAPFKAIELEHAKQLTNYMNGMNIFIPGNIGPHNFGGVLATGSVLITQWKFRITNIPEPSGVKFFLRLRILVKIGDLYLKYPGSGSICHLIINGSGSPYFLDGITNQIPIFEWTATPSEFTLSFNVGKVYDIQNGVYKTLEYSINSLFSYYLFVLQSEEIQEEGEMIFQFINFKLYDKDLTEIATNPAITMNLEPDSRIVIGSSYEDLYEIPKSIKKYEVGQIKNTLVYKTKLKYFDSDKLTFEQLFINNSSYPTDEPTIEWTDPDSDITLPIQDLMLKSMLAMRQYPAQLFKMEFIFLTKDIFRMDKRVAIDDELYIPLDLEIFSGTGVHRVTLLKVYKDFEGINIVNIDENVPSVPYPAPDGSLGSLYPGGGGGGSVEHFEEWANVSTAYVEVDGLAGYIPSNEYDLKTKVFFYINGVRQRYKNGTLALREFKFDFDNNRILFFKGSGNVGHIEFIKYR